MKTEKKIRWFKVADAVAALPWQPNGMCIVVADDKKVTLATYQQKIVAFAYKCPHAGAIMADGFLDATGNVVCPLHRYRFALQNGRNTSGEGYYLKTYEVEERADGLYVGMEEKSFWSF